MVSPLESVLTSWIERDKALQGAGIDRTSYKELARRDIRNVMRGGQALPAQEVNVAIVNQALKRPIIQEPQRGTRPLDIPGNIPKDIEDIARGFIPGIVGYFRNLPAAIERGFSQDKEEYQRTYGLDQGQNAAQRVSQHPIFGVLPGAFTWAASSDEMKQRPITTLLDVLPFAAAATRGAALTRPAAAKGTALQAAQKGHVVRATFRATTDALSKVPGGRALRRDVWNNYAAQMGIDATTREKLSRPFSQTQRKADREARKFIDTEIMPLFTGLDEAQRTALTEYGIRRKNRQIDPDTYNPMYETILGKVDELSENLAKMGEDAGGVSRVYIPGAEKSFLFSSDSPVVKTRTRLTSAEEARGRIESRVINARNVLDERINKLNLRKGKIRHFMEEEGAFNAREEGPVGPGVIREASRAFVEAFQFLEPEKVFGEYLEKLMSGTHRMQAFSFLRRDFNKLKGESGLIAKMDEALAKGEVKAASQYATQISRIIRHKSWDNFDTTTRIRRHLDDIRREMVGLRKRTVSYDFAERMLVKAQDRVARYEDLAARNAEKIKVREQEFFDAIAANPPRSFHPLLLEKIRAQATNEAKLLYSGAELDRVLRLVDESPSFRELQSLIDQGQPGRFKEIMQETAASWIDLSIQGFNPIWLHHVPTRRLRHALRPRLLPDREITPSQWEDVVLNFGPGVTDVAVGLSAAAAEYIAMKGTHRFITDHVMPFAKDKAAVREQISGIVHGKKDAPRPSFGAKGEIDKILAKEWRDFNPDKFGMRSPSPTREGWVVPVGIDRALNAFGKDFRYGTAIPGRGLYDRTLKVFKFSVLFGPKQLADIVFGGMVTLLAREPKGLFQLGRAFEQFRKGEIPEELMHNYYELDADKIHHFQAGKTMGRHMLDFIKFAPERLGKLEENVSSMYRAAAFLAAEKRALGQHMTPLMAREYGLRQAYKVLVDFDGMSHIERAVVRQVFPFYSFMRYVMQYALTYPSDHPLRAAILSRFADMEKREQTNGIAEKYKNYFFLGEPDENGSVRAVDYRSANPFQSVSNLFTMAGYLSAVNPLVTAAFEAAGLNLLTATPDLFPDKAFDPETGSLTARRENVLMTIAGNIVPQIEGVDTWLTISDEKRRLKDRNPESWERQKWGALHIPFTGLVPGTGGVINLPYEVQKAEIGRLRGARAEVSSATREGDFTRARRYNLVPYQGELVDPNQLAEFWATIQARLNEGGVEANPRAILPRR